ncbi:MAG: response regulator transcription factor [Chloroflexi bacterium]|nr:response regulator transcription factor [Chloroflexota bacterium]
MNILVIEDERKTSELIQLYLHHNGYNTLMALDGRTGLEMARTHQPDLIVLDLMLPGLDGLDLCRILRAEANIPIIMLTARSTEDDKLLGLDLGADDYLTKPFSPRELVARVRTVLRRVGQRPGDEPVITLAWGALCLNISQHTVTLAEQPITLTPKEFRLLETLMREPGRVFNRVELLEKAFGLDYDGLERTIDVHIRNLRQKIEPHPNQPVYVQTVFGVGYRLGDS